MARPTIKSLQGKLTTMTALMQRMQLAVRAGLAFGTKRDYYEVFGYPKVLTFDHFFAKYARQDIASRIINAPAEGVWDNPPKVTGNEAFNATWEELIKKRRVWSKLLTADKLCGLGEFSIVFMGFDDGGSPNTPVRKRANSELLYLQPYSQASVKRIELEDNPSNERFGLPRMYKVDVTDPSTMSVASQSGVSRVIRTRTLDVHHSRVLHVAENTLESDIFGIPRLAQVYNVLDDLLKVVGGAAEMFWLSGRHGLHLNVDKEMELSGPDAKELSDEAEEYQHQLRRVLRTRGVDANVLQGEVPNPEATFNALISLISGATGIPKRILLGAEIGQLASEQDRANWADRITERRRTFAEPNMLMPFLEGLQAAGALPEDEYEFEWPNAFSMSPLDEARRGAQVSRTVFQLSRQAEKGNALMSVEEARELIGLPREIPKGDTKFKEQRPQGRQRPPRGGNGVDPEADGNVPNGGRQAPAQQASE